MDIDLNSASISVNIDDSKADVGLSSDGQWAALHLTRNAEPVIEGSQTASDMDASAIAISGSVDLRLGQGENAANWTFRFIQFVALMQAYVSYAGRNSDEGFISVNYAAPPAFRKGYEYDFNLDAGPEIFGSAVMPFTNLREQGIFPKLTQQGDRVQGVFSAVNSMDDHPKARVKVTMKNIATNRRNYLAQMISERYFVTAYVVRDERTKKITPLASVAWRTFWRARFRWVQGNCLPQLEAGALDVEKPVKGAPKEGTWGRTAASLAAKIVNPPTDPNLTANALVRAAFKSFDNHPEFWNLNYSDEWPASLPQDFWSNR